VKLFECDKDTVATVSGLLGLTTPNDNPTPRKNACMNSVTAELYRVINRLPLSAKEKEKVVPYLNDLDAVLTPYSDREESLLIDDASRDKIIKMTAEDFLEIRKRFVSVS
jgi:hypothetical protein